MAGWLASGLAGWLAGGWQLAAGAWRLAAGGSLRTSGVPCASGMSGRDAGYAKAARYTLPEDYILALPMWRTIFVTARRVDRKAPAAR